MPSLSTARVVLELEVGADPIRGSIDNAGGGSRHSFWGWLELIEELTRLSVGQRDPSSQPRRVDQTPVAPSANQRQTRMTTGQQL